MNLSNHKAFVSYDSGERVILLSLARGKPGAISTEGLCFVVDVAFYISG